MTQTRKHHPDKASPTRCCAELEGLLNPEFFKALGDPRRQAILLRLATAGGTWTVTQVADALPIDISVVSRHLAQLRGAGVLAAERQGKEVRYSVRYDTIVTLLRQLADSIEGCCPPESTNCCAQEAKESPHA